MINTGYSFITMTLGMNGWKKGQLIKVVKINGTNFIKTYTDQTTTDNLGELPEF
jgi:hypothetical protein